MPAKVLHLITSLNMGGAETMLCQVLEHTDRQRFAPIVVSLRPESALSPRVRATGFPLHHLDMRGWRSGGEGWSKLRKLLREEKPDLVQTWMYHANLLGSLALAGSKMRPPLVWNITHGAMPKGSAKILSQLLRRALAPVSSRSPDRIIVCAHSAIEEHARLGYSRARMTYVSNGVDCVRFAPDATARAEVRAELGIPAEAPVVGISARYNSLKDYPTFFAAVRHLEKKIPQAHFVACGGSVSDANAELAREKQSCARPEHVHLLGPRTDMPRVLSAWDLATLCSVCEAQPLSLCEALACGLPCVATDAGDSSDIIGSIGEVVPIGNPEALARAWEITLCLPLNRRDNLRKAARERALERFALPNVVRQYEDLYEKMLEDRGANECQIARYELNESRGKQADLGMLKGKV